MNNIYKVIIITALFIALSISQAFANGLFHAVSINDIKETQRLLDNGADINAKDNYGWTALMLAARNGHKEVIQVLLDNRADIHAKDNGGWTALMRAVFNGHKEAIQVLLDNRADIHTRDNKGWTALMLAARYQTKEVVELLLKNGANPNQKSKNIVGILELARINKYPGVMATLRKYGAK